jgi:putative Mg2+ transporter-C (MgtC) family protein
MAEINYLLIVAQFLIIAGLSSIIGWERERSKNLVKGTAGLRTHMIVGLAATLLTMISIYGFSQYQNADPGRIVSYIILGIGFIGAGTIMGFKGEVVGLTTAASIWLVSAIGIAVGLGLYILAVITTVFAWLILELWHFEKKVEEGNTKGIVKLLSKK